MKYTWGMVETFSGYGSGILIPGKQGQDFFLVGSSPGGAKQGQWIIMDWFKFFLQEKP
jgi:hypothetical protein